MFLLVYCILVIDFKGGKMDKKEKMRLKSGLKRVHFFKLIILSHYLFFKILYFKFVD